jgi:hypothetical protein
LEGFVVIVHLPAELGEVLQDLGQCIKAMGSYRKTAVLCGGVAALLYRWHPAFVNVVQPPLSTFDMDWALPGRLVLQGPGLHKRMRDGGFEVWLNGVGSKPVTYYQHQRHGNERLARIHAEFITPRPGSMTDRRGRNMGIVEVEPDLHAQTDPYVGLLLVENIEIDVSCIESLALSEEYCVRLPHPALFIIQKILIRHRRQPHKRANDAAHIYDVALITRPLWPKMAETLARVEESGAFPRLWFKRARDQLSEIVAGQYAPAPTEVADIYRSIMGTEAAPTADAICRVLTQFGTSIGLLRA